MKRTPQERLRLEVIDQLKMVDWLMMTKEIDPHSHLSEGVDRRLRQLAIYLDGTLAYLKECKTKQKQ